MKKGISISITRPIETRLPRSDERMHRIWSGTRWVTLSSFPHSPALSHILGNATVIRTTKLEFPPLGTVTPSAQRYKNGLEKEMRALGVIK